MNGVLASVQKGYDIIVGGGQYKDLSVSDDVCYALSVVNLTTRQHGLIPLGFLPHGICADPNLPQRLIVCEKIGPGAALVDIESMTMVDPIITDPQRLFYGHCAFSADGAYFFTTETYRNSRKGVIVVRETAGKNILGEFPSYGESPHECYLTDSGKTLVVTNGGGDLTGDKPNVAYIDVASQELIKREWLTNRHINAGHLMLAENGALVVVSAPRSGLSADKLGGVSIQPKEKKMRTISSPKKVVNNMRGEALSVTIHQGTAAVTHPAGNMVTFWSTDDRRLLKKIDLPGPRGITLTRYNKYFVISYGHQASLILVDLLSLTLLQETGFSNTYLTGSHLYNWSSIAVV